MGGDSEEPDEPDEDGGVSRRIVVGTGRGLDKRDRFETRKHISTDWDLQKLSLLGPILWSVVLVVFIAGTVWYVAFSAGGYLDLVLGLLGDLASFRLPEINAFARSRSLEVVSVLAVTAWIAPRVVALVRKEVANIREKALAGLYQVRHLGVLLDIDTWSNHNYWHPFTSHLSDRDPLVMLANADLDATVSGVFTDVPYYRNVFVDSVYVTFDSLPDRTTRLELEWFDWRLAYPRRYVLGAAVLLLVVTRFPATIGVVPALPSVPWSTLELGALYGLSGYIVVTAFTDYVGFRRRFFGNSAGFSEYGLLQSTEKSTLFDDEAKTVDRLGNSLAGYGLFYVSEFLWSVVGRDSPYRVENAVEADEDNREIAAEAGTELLERAIPTPTTAETEDDGNDESIEMRLQGVDYLRQDVHRRRLLERVPGVGKRYGRSVGEGNDRGLDHAGAKRGVRLPVKRFVSVPHPFFADYNLETNDEFPFYFDRTWDEDETHYLLLGGAEHQEALVKFIQYLRSPDGAGFENVDLIENAFTDEDDLQFVSEYFVSSVLRGDDDFRGSRDEDGKVFLVLRHHIDDDRTVHVVYGMGALESKMAFLFWLDAFPEVPYDDDVLYRVRYRDNVDDVGRLYADPSWLNDPTKSVTFDWQTDTETPVVEGGESTLDCRQIDVEVRFEDGDE
jgi:hypothetical protein